MIRAKWPAFTRRLYVFGLCGALSLASLSAKDREIPSGMRAQIEQAIARVKPALVRIRVVSTEYSEGREIKAQAVGSGAIISRDGYLITNHHVAGHATRMFCTLYDREEIEADLIGTDPLTDISILKLRPEKPREFTPAEFGDSSGLRVGDYVLAMGSPMALSQSVTLGIVSNTEMVMPRFWGGSQFRLDGEDVGGLVRWIGHDAAIYGGNSGGPLVNLSGQIVGINEISYGLGGAIPGNLARKVADALIAKGKVIRSWIGIDAQPLFKRSNELHGVIISGVLPGSPADRAGVKPGDLLLKVAGHPTDVRFDEQMPDFMAAITSLPVGKSVPIVVQRDGHELPLQLVAAERGEIFPPQAELKPWGITARDYSALLAREMKRPDQAGVLVTSVRSGGPSGEAKPALSAGDTIVEVAGQPVNSVEELRARTHELLGGKSDPVPVIATFERTGARYMTVVRIGSEDLKDPGLEVTKAWLPIETHVISREIARQLGRPSLKGFYITRVYPHSTAEKAGLKPGDFITGIDDDKLSASDSEYEDELASLIRQYDVGKTVDLTVLRGGHEMKVPVELIRSPRLPREMKKYRNDEFDFTARDISFFDTAEEQWNSGQKGVLIEEVKAGSWAELGLLSVGDLLLEVDGQPVDNVEALRREMDRISAQRPEMVTMKVLRGIHTAYLELEPNWKN